MKLGPIAVSHIEYRYIFFELIESNIATWAKSSPSDSVHIQLLTLAKAIDNKS